MIYNPPNVNQNPTTHLVLINQLLLFTRYGTHIMTVAVKGRFVEKVIFYPGGLGISLTTTRKP